MHVIGHNFRIGNYDDWTRIRLWLAFRLAEVTAFGFLHEVTLLEVEAEAESK